MQDPTSISNELAPSTRVPIGTKTGMDELRAVLDASDPTNAPPLRRVVISIPAGVPDSMCSQEATTTAIREFFLIAGESLRLRDDTPRTAPDLESPQGVRARLPNGGEITLRIRRVNLNGEQRAIGEIRLGDHQIPGYEQVNQIEFVTQ